MSEEEKLLKGLETCEELNKFIDDNITMRDMKKEQLALTRKEFKSITTSTVISKKRKDDLLKQIREQINDHQHDILLIESKIGKATIKLKNKRCNLK